MEVVILYFPARGRGNSIKACQAWSPAGKIPEALPGCRHGASPGMVVDLNHVVYGGD
jgi:hypothetical protein